MEATISTREGVMDYVWDKFFEYFSQNEWGKAEASFTYYSRLEEMTDAEYDDACHCDKPGCYCM